MTLVDEIKDLIIEALELEDVSPADIDASEPLFGDGLGLDSIDALELGLALQEKYKVKIDASDSATRDHFQSVDSLAAFVSSSRT